MSQQYLATQSVFHTVFVSEDGTTPKTNTRFVAEVFGKLHKNVLLAVQNLDCSDEFRRLNFKPSSYLNSQNKEQPMYEMTFDGFTFLVMGFTGKEAAVFKEAYIAEFNRMRQAIQDTVNERIDFLEQYVRLPSLPMTDGTRALVVQYLHDRMPIADIARVCRCSQNTVRLIKKQMIEDNIQPSLIEAS